VAADATPAQFGRVTEFSGTSARLAGVPAQDAGSDDLLPVEAPRSD
jgi:hypothetical protein